MFAPPGLTPVTIPVGATMATKVLLLLQLPPVAGSVKPVVAAIHTPAAPEIVPAMGKGITVMGCVAITDPQALETRYVIVAPPPDTPVTIPVAPTVAIAVLPLLQTPPVTDSIKEMAAPAHTDEAPVMVPETGGGLTVIIRLVLAVPHPLVTVYVIAAVPRATPVTIPDTPTVATAALLLLHTPPPTESLKGILTPGHTVVAPVMVPADGAAFTVTTASADVISHGDPLFME